MSTIVIAQVSTGTTIISSATTGIQGPAGPPVAVGVAGQFYVTNAAATLPEWKSLSGDVTDSAVTTGQITVAKVNGATAPAAGALTTGNVLQVSGVSALSYGAVNLAGGSNYVTGALPLTNLAQDAAATSQAMVWNGTQWAPGSVVSSGISPGMAWQGLTTKADASSSLWTTTPTADVVALYGADPTGAADSSAAFQAAVNALAGTGVALFVPAGTYKIANPITLPSDIVIIGTPSTTLKSTMAPDGAQGQTIFYSIYVTSGASTTLSTSNTVGASTILTAASIGAGTIIRVADAATSLYVGYYVVASVSGLGPYTLTLDRPVLRQWTSGDVVQPMSSQPTNIKIFGNGMLLTGTGDRYVEIWGAYQCVIDNVRFDTSGGHLQASSICGSFDLGSRECEWRNCRGDAAGTTDTVFALESNERSSVINCWAFGGTGAAIDLYDCVDCSVINSHAWTSVDGLAFNADATSIGCTNCSCIGGSFIGNSSAGIVIAGGSTNTVISAADVRYNTSYGIQEDLSGGATNQTTIQGCAVTYNGIGGLIEGARAQIVGSDFSNNTNEGVNLTGDVSITNFRAWGGNPNGAIVSAGPATRIVSIYGADIQGNNASWSPIQIGAGTTCYISGMHLQNDHTGGNLILINGTCTVENSKIDGSGVSGTTVFYANGGWIRLGQNVDASTFGANAFFTTGGGKISVLQGEGVYTSSATTGTDTVSQPNAQCGSITSAAALTGDVTINVPAHTPGLRYVVYNGTSGAHTWSVGVTGGTAITVPQGYRAVVESDGTNMQLVSIGQTTSAIQTDSGQSSLTVGTNKTGAALVLQADAATTIQTIASTGTELANLSTPAAGTGPRTFGSSGRLGHVSSTGHITLLPGG